MPGIFYHYCHCVFVGSFHQQMRDAGFQQLLSDLRNYGDATVSSVAATISLSDNIP